MSTTIIEVKTQYPCGSYYIDLDKANGQEAFVLQTFGYYPSIFVFGILRLDEIIKCHNLEQLFNYDRFAFFTDELRKKAFENIFGQDIPIPMNVARIVNRINKYGKKEFDWGFDFITHEGKKSKQILESFMRN